MKNSLLQQIIEMYLGYVFLSSSSLLWREAHLLHSRRENLSCGPKVTWLVAQQASELGLFVGDSKVLSIPPKCLS